MAKANKLPGLYIAFDGIIGCGKSTQIKELKRYLSHDFPGCDLVFTYEPGGNKAADEIRKRLKFEKMSYEEEVSLFARSRSITMPEIVIPVLERGGIIISDRSIVTTLAYWAYGARKLGIKKVWSVNKGSVGGVFPDILVYMEVGIEESLKRSARENPDKFDAEGKDFWQKNITGFYKALVYLKKISPKTKIVKIIDEKVILSVEDIRLKIKKEIYPEITKVFKRK